MALLYPSPPADESRLIQSKLIHPRPSSVTTSQWNPNPSPLHDLAQLATSMVYRIWHSALPSMAMHSMFYSFALKIMTLTSTNVSPSVVITALLLVQRLKERLSCSTPGRHRPSDQSEFRIWLTALLLADTLLNDNAFTCASWSQVSGFPLSEVITMKREFMETLGYNLYVSEVQYGVWLKSLLVIESLSLPTFGVLSRNLVSPSTPPPEEFSTRNRPVHTPYQQPSTSRLPTPCSNGRFSMVVPPNLYLPPSCSQRTYRGPVSLPPMMI